MADAWRVVDSEGVVHEAPTPSGHKGAAIRLAGSDRRAGVGLSERDALSGWALAHDIDWTEIVPPGQLTKAEAVAAETARVTGLMEWWASYSGEAAGHLSCTRSVEQFAFHRGLLHLLELVAKGEGAPNSDPKEEALKACQRTRSGKASPNE